MPICDTPNTGTCGGRISLRGALQASFLGLSNCFGHGGSHQYS